MTERENESLADWLFYRRKHRQRRVAHTTRTISTTTNTGDNE